MFIVNYIVRINSLGVVSDFVLGMAGIFSKFKFLNISYGSKWDFLRIVVLGFCFVYLLMYLIVFLNSIRFKKFDYNI